MLFENQKKILFVHIPKTAGTSFRIAAEKYLKNGVIYDYGYEANQTSDIVRNFVYDKKDFYELYMALQRQNQMVFLSGHFPLKKYIHMFSPMETVSIVREPVAQIVSHYNHLKFRGGMKDTLEEFIHKKRFQNLQSEVLKGIPIGMLGLLGITERYQDFVELFNGMYQVNFSPLYLNTKVSQALELEEIDKKLIREIRTLNQQDIRLYGKARKIFALRHEFLKSNLPWTYGVSRYDRGKKSIRGLAYRSEKDTPIEVAIFDGEKHLTDVLANEANTFIRQCHLPRMGFVAFSYTHKKKIEKGLRAVIKETGQKLI